MHRCGCERLCITCSGVHFADFATNSPQPNQANHYLSITEKAARTSSLLAHRALMRDEVDDVVARHHPVDTIVRGRSAQ